MLSNKRFTIMTFPQSYDGDKTLRINILFLPRAQNPFKAAIEASPTIHDAPAFVDSILSFKAAIVKGFESFPNNKNTADAPPATLLNQPGNKPALFTSLASPANFKIESDASGLLPQSNALLQENNSKTSKPENRPRTLATSIKKYLPVSYRQAFNFISSKHPNAVVDDSYHCALRSAKNNPAFLQSSDTVSWGKVFAFVMRNSLLAKEAGFIYEASVEVNDMSLLEEGGYLYIDLAGDSHYKLQQTDDDDFIKKYAARIPALKPGTPRLLFAANLFPVLYMTDSDLTEPKPVGNYDNIFIEAADYDDGFAKITHCFQPVSQNHLAEESNGFHPTHESGIRLGWDDEQILLWYTRQMAADEASLTGERIDAPTGVFGYHIDVKDEDDASWHSLNAVATRPGVDAIGGLIPGEPPQRFAGEMPYQVYPSNFDGDMMQSFWLPMYFANWNGHSMVLPNEDEIKIYQHDENVKSDAKTNVTGKPDNNLLKIYEPQDLVTKLKYGATYHFRMRMTDLSHGGPPVTEDKVNDALAPIATRRFKRYVAPTTLRIMNAPDDYTELFNQPALELQRPLLSYPAVDFCDKYNDAVGTLIAKLKNEVADAKVLFAATTKKSPLNNIGLADPDVEKVEITVEVQALKMDYQLSDSKKEAYAVLYKTERTFAPAVEEDGEFNYDKILSVPIEFRDAHVLDFDDTSSYGDLGVSFSDLKMMDAIVLPRARDIRLTIRAVCKDEDNYYGLEKPDPVFNTRYGRTTYVRLYQPSVNEKDLYSVKQVVGIYLQPDEVKLAKSVLHNHKYIQGAPVKMPDSIQRLAQQLKIESNAMGLVGKKGERIQFGCSARIRHTLAPDNSALTFASKEELYHHWLCCITLDLKRDWTWDALKDLSFVITRSKFFKKEPGNVKKEIVGEMEMKRSISFTALQEPQRFYTKLVFIDAVEPKKEQGDSEPDFPDEIEVTYTVEAVFKDGHGSNKDAAYDFPTIQLPVTIHPVQIPKLASAGIALSPYHRNEKYSSTQPRRRFLWLEFAEPVKDPHDLYFGRVMAYSPDQMLSNNNHALENKIEDPALNIDPEYIRIISPGASDDEAGIDAMQPLEKSLLSDRHYLLPLPPGLNESSPELFGFFAYEFRVGHGNPKHKIWSTAQGRFGRPLKVTGMQHPAPTLTCAVHRDEEKLYVTAPYATAVFNGKNVTANPPRTQLWCLLYAQVKQADNNDADKDLKDYRNILLNDRFMHWGFKLTHKRDRKPDADIRDAHLSEQPFLNMADTTIHRTHKGLAPLVSPKLIIDKMQIADNNIKYISPVTHADIAETNADATKTATTFWTNKEVNELLKAYGLPIDLSLSVLCVEVFSNITNEHDYRTRNIRLDEMMEHNVGGNIFGGDINASGMAVANQVKPLSTGLGNFRILRTSPLVEVPFVCCTD